MNGFEVPDVLFWLVLWNPFYLHTTRASGKSPTKGRRPSSSRSRETNLRNLFLRLSLLKYFHARVV